jgi:hypothetical protein
MAKEKIPTLKQKNGCKHEHSDPLYLRGSKMWTSTQKVLGHMIFACYDCGAFFKKQSNKIEVNDAVE